MWIYVISHEHEHVEYVLFISHLFYSVKNIFWSRWDFPRQTLCFRVVSASQFYKIYAKINPLKVHTGEGVGNLILGPDHQLIIRYILIGRPWHQRVLGVHREWRYRRTGKFNSRLQRYSLLHWSINSSWAYSSQSEDFQTVHWKVRKREGVNGRGEGLRTVHWKTRKEEGVNGRGWRPQTGHLTVRIGNRGLGKNALLFCDEMPGLKKNCYLKS